MTQRRAAIAFSAQGPSRGTSLASGSLSTGDELDSQSKTVACIAGFGLSLSRAAISLRVLVDTSNEDEDIRSCGTGFILTEKG